MAIVKKTFYQSIDKRAIPLLGTTGTVLYCSHWRTNRDDIIGGENSIVIKIELDINEGELGMPSILVMAGER